MIVLAEHPGNFVDLTGKRFGSWTVNGLAYQKNWRLYWDCTCDCGNKRLMRGDTLANIRWPYCSNCKSHNKVIEISSLDIKVRKQVRERIHGLFSSTLIVDGDLVYGYSSDSLCFIFDKQDLEVVNRYSWRRSMSRGYICANVRQKFTHLHTLIMGDLSCKMKVDHISLDKYDNRRSNLRFCTDHENAFNRGISRQNTLGYKGLTKTVRGRYGAIIGFCNQQFAVGYYSSKEEAAAAYDYAAMILHGDFARRNCDIFDNVEQCDTQKKLCILHRVTKILLKITSEKYRYLVEGAEERVNKELRIILEGEKCMKELVPMKERIFKRKSAAEI